MIFELKEKVVGIVTISSRISMLSVNRSMSLVYKLLLTP